MIEILKRIEDLRDELHNAIEEGNQDNILHKSRVLDIEILKFISLGEAREGGIVWRPTN